MLCTKCSAMNSDGDSFCYACGSPLGANAQPGGAYSKADAATINATTMLAAKEARKVDVANLRPLTRAAYNISESEHSATLSLLLSLLNVVLSLGLVAVLIKIFDTISLLGQSVTSSSIEGSFSDLFYGSSTSNNVQLLCWLVVLLLFMVGAFLVCGRLGIRVRKVNRKKKREQLDSRL